MTKFELLRYIHFVDVSNLYKRKMIWKVFVFRSSFFRRFLCIYKIAQSRRFFNPEFCPKKFFINGAFI